MRACLPFGTTGAGSHLRDAVHAWKYGGDLPVGAALVDLFVERTARFPTDADLVVPVPTRPERLRRRGFDQAAELARALARSRRLPLRRALRRVEPASSQTALGRLARIDNVRGAFRVVGPQRVLGVAVLLVDDVLTSGATVAECASVLRRAGARRVEMWALGRSVR